MFIVNGTKFQVQQIQFTLLPLYLEKNSLCLQVKFECKQGNVGLWGFFCSFCFGLWFWGFCVGFFLSNKTKQKIPTKTKPENTQTSIKQKLCLNTYMILSVLYIRRSTDAKRSFCLKCRFRKVQLSFLALICLYFPGCRRSLYTINILMRPVAGYMLTSEWKSQLINLE